MPKRTATAHVHSLYKTLYRKYGPQLWWPARSAWEMMVGALLTQNTAWTNVEMAIKALKSSRLLTPQAVLSAPLSRLQKMIRPSGFYRQKSIRLKNLARVYLENPAIVRDRAKLLEQPGIGPETADSIVLYAGKRPAFVVDAYSRRIGERLGWFKGLPYDDVQAFFQSRIPKKVRLYNEYHALLVRLAKEHCRSHHPRCADCPVKRHCPTGRKSHER